MKAEIEKLKIAKEANEKKLLQEREESISAQENARVLIQQLEDTKLRMDEQSDAFEAKLREFEDQLQTELDQKKSFQKLIESYQERMKNKDLEMEKLREGVEVIRKETQKKEDKFILQNKALDQKEER